MRKPQVTRTINSTSVVAICLDVENSQAYEGEFNIPGIVRDEKKMLKALANKMPAGHRAVSIKSSQLVKTLYGMPEETFLEHAHQLPPRSQSQKEED